MWVPPQPLCISPDVRLHGQDLALAVVVLVVGLFSVVMAFAAQHDGQDVVADGDAPAIARPAYPRGRGATRVDLCLGVV